MILPREFESAVTLPERVIGYVSVESRGGVSVLDATAPTSAEPFHGRSASDREAVRVRGEDEA